MLFKLRNLYADKNPWAEQDRQEMRKLVATAMIFLIATCSGLIWLVYALISA